MSRVLSEPGACDCHMHFYRPAASISEFTSRNSLPLIDAKNYENFLSSIGATRFVAVQSIAYGFDNTVMQEEAAYFGDNARLIPVLPLATSESEIAVWDSQGGRGIRAYLLDGVGACYEWSDLPQLASLIQPFGWHLQVQFDGRLLPEYEQLLKALPCDIVIDHIGKFLEPVTTDSPEFSCLLRLIDTGRVWVKLSAPYETSKTGAPFYEDVSQLAKTLIAHAPERLVWASNYPHPGMAKAPTSEDLVALLDYWVSDDKTRQLILKETPENLYNF